MTGIDPKAVTPPRIPFPTLPTSAWTGRSVTVTLGLAATPRVKAIWLCEKGDG